MIVYLVTNKVNGKQYVGQTKGKLSNRWAGHCCAAKKGKGYVLQDAIRKYGPESFDIIPIEICDSMDDLNESEIYWIEWYQTLAPGGYNLEVGGKNAPTTPETKAKLRAINLDKNTGPRGPMSDSHKQKLSESHKGKKFSDEHRASLCVARAGRKPGLGSKRTEEQKSRKRAQFADPILRAKCGAANIGREPSPETRAKLSAAATAQHAAKRQSNLKE